MSAPGAGKTTLLERALAEPLDGVRVGVLEGDVQGSHGRRPARRAARAGDPAQHRLRASAASATSTPTWSARRCPRCRSTSIDLLVIENVGNLVCPAEFRVGEDVRVMVCSVTEGEDKPLKYPLMFRTCELVVVNKIDLLPHLDFDLDRFLYNLDAVHPGVRADAGQRAHRRGRRRAGATGSRGWRPPSGCRRWRDAALRADASRDARRSCSSGAREANAALLRAPRPSALARLCHRMAERFARGGRLVALGRSPGRALGRAPRRGRVRPPGDRRQARAAGARRWPARAGRCRCRSALLAEPDDIVDRLRRRRRRRGGAALAAAARARLPDGRLRAPLGAEWEFEPPSDDPFVARSWSRRSTTCCGSSCTCSSSTAACSRAATAARGARHRRLELPLPVPGRGRDTTSRRCSTTCARSVLMKAEEVGALREQTLSDERDDAAARRPPRCATRFDAGGKLLALGNGGSATDAMDAVADFRAAAAGWPARRRST